MLINKKLLIVLLLGFSSGLPLALTGATLQAWFASSNSNIMAIGTLTLLGIPYTLKFLWAPLMDHYAIPFLGKRRGWILLMQLALVFSLFSIAQMDPLTQAWQMGIVALTIAFFLLHKILRLMLIEPIFLHPKNADWGCRILFLLTEWR